MHAGTTDKKPGRAKFRARTAMDLTAEGTRERSATREFKAAQRPRTPCGMRPLQDADEMTQRQRKRSRQEACAAGPCAHSDPDEPFDKCSRRQITVLERKDDGETDIGRGARERRPSSAWAHLIGSSRREGAELPTAGRGVSNDEREEKRDGSREDSRRNGEAFNPQHQGVQAALHMQRAADAWAQQQVAIDAPDEPKHSCQHMTLANRQNTHTKVLKYRTEHGSNDEREVEAKGTATRPDCRSASTPRHLHSCLNHPRVDGPLAARPPLRLALATSIVTISAVSRDIHAINFPPSALLAFLVLSFGRAYSLGYRRRRMHEDTNGWARVVLPVPRSPLSSPMRTQSCTRACTTFATKRECRCGQRACPWLGVRYVERASLSHARDSAYVVLRAYARGCSAAAVVLALDARTPHRIRVGGERPQNPDLVPEPEELEGYSEQGGTTARRVRFSWHFKLVRVVRPEPYLVQS
ncbi:hypothetical protein B0H17DRAFT_1149071 [Mycena rosella]|uniref:Uncharacterized protein n=1 Tax=Mycena rosella TaxID=1033263 RepID=A0AAD7FVI5_MYCRO|nr:hypothetical protein B0H17DRAFT_1149071 [Mycena rosella]